MPRGLLFVLCSSVLWGQGSRREPFDLAIQAYRDARASGDFGSARDRREEARHLLAQTSLDSPQLPNRVATVVELYRGAGWNARARTVVEEALSRSNSLGESDPLRIQLLSMLAYSWQQDGNLLRALSYRERIVAALEASPPAINPVTDGPANRAASHVVFSGGIQSALVRRANTAQGYQQLADLYRQLGRPETAAKVVAKMRSAIQDDPRSVAASYEREGNFDEALALYKKLAEQAAANPQDAIGPLQSIAGLYQRQQRWDDAAAALEQAAGRLEAASTPGSQSQAVGIRLRTANLYQQAGQNQAADKIYQALLAESANNDRNGASMQVTQAYAQYLSNTKRVGLAEELLKSYLSNHQDLQPGQETSILFALSGIERNAGRNDLAEEFQQAGLKKQRALQPQNPAEEQPKRLLISPDLQKAQAALSQGNLDEAVNLTLNALGLASQARDSEQVGWQVANIAAGLAGRKALEKAEQLYRELLALVQSWSIDNTLPLIQAQQQYARFLIGQKDRRGEAPAAMERYRENLILTRGAESSELEQAMHLRIDFARARGARGEAVQAAEELLAFEESLSGVTSAPYMRAAQSAAGVYQYSGDVEGALALHRKIIGIADLTLSPNDAQRGAVRISAAFALAGARRFDEAERMAKEAVAVGEGMRPPRREFAAQLAEIQRLIEVESQRASSGVR
jgi:hypothetical protein